MHWWIIVLASLGLACSKREAPPPVEPESATSDTEAAKDEGPSESTDEPARTEAAAALSVGDPPEIQLIEPGKEPLRTLRWSIKPGLEQTLSIKTTVQIDGLLGGWLTARGHQPRMTYEINVKSNQAVPGEPAHLTFRIKKASADLSETPKKLRAKMRKAAKTVQGARGSYSFDSRGLVKDIKIELPSDASPEAHNMAKHVEWSLSQMIAPFPEAPVGEGAKWSVAIAAEQDGIRINQFSTVEIAKLQGPLVDIRIEIEQSGPPQDFKPHADSSGRKFYLTGFSSKGNLEATWDLAEVIPRSASLADTSEKRVRYELEGRLAESAAVTKRTITMGRK